MKKIITELRFIIAHELMNFTLKVLPKGDEREEFAFMVYIYMKRRLAYKDIEQSGQ